MADKEIALTVRLPKKLRDAMKKKAVESNRSMNAEIVTALQAWTTEDRKERE